MPPSPPIPVTINKVADLQGERINPYIGCGAGAVLDFLLGKRNGEDKKLGLVENVLVGVFGAFLGGDLIISQLNKFTSLLWAIGGSAGMLFTALAASQRGTLAGRQTPQRRQVLRSSALQPGSRVSSKK